MKITILSRKRSFYSTKRLVEEGRAAGHAVSVLNSGKVQVVVDTKGQGLRSGGRQVKSPDVLLTRVSSVSSDSGISIIRQFEITGVRAINSSLSLARVRDKLISLQVLSSAGIDVPRTILLNGAESLQQALREVGGVPAVIKLLRGAQGVGVFLAETIPQAESIVEGLMSAGQKVILQRYVSEARGRDTRAFVVGGEVIAAMNRSALPGEFRANIHRGGAGTKARLTPEQEKMALAGAVALGLEVCGVDLIETENGPAVLEVNSSPGFEGIEFYTGVNVAAEIVRYSAAASGNEPRADRAAASQAYNGESAP